MHFVTSTGQEIEFAAKSRLVLQRVANSIAELLVVGGPFSYPTRQSGGPVNAGIIASFAPI
jgi:hypothetical protein